MILHLRAENLSLFAIISEFSIIGSEAKRAKRAERSDFLSDEVLDFFGISKTKHFRAMLHRTKSVCFDPNSRYLK